MPQNSRPYILDANVFMQAFRDKYPFDVCPGFWEALTQQHKQGNILSIDRVRQEIINGDELLTWVKNEIPKDFFQPTNTPDVTLNFAQMMQWAQNEKQFKPEAKSEFASVADGWLAAFAQAKNGVVVTEEVFIPEVKKRIPLPNVCQAFGIHWGNTISMLRDLNIRLVLAPSPQN